jgi:hypothetical protein
VNEHVFQAWWREPQIEQLRVLRKDDLRGAREQGAGIVACVQAKAQRCRRAVVGSLID